MQRTEHYPQSHIWNYNLGRQLRKDLGGLSGGFYKVHTKIFLIRSQYLFFEATIKWSLSLSNIFYKSHILASFINIRQRQDSEFSNFWPRAMANVKTDNAISFICLKRYFLLIFKNIDWVGVKLLKFIGPNLSP